VAAHVHLGGHTLYTWECFLPDPLLKAQQNPQVSIQSQWLRAQCMQDLDVE
jgi:hypothetical protein